jgi:hypothetical protein
MAGRQFSWSDQPPNGQVISVTRSEYDSDGKLISRVSFPPDPSDTDQSDQPDPLLPDEPFISEG